MSKRQNKIDQKSTLLGVGLERRFRMVQSDSIRFAPETPTFQFAEPIP